MARKKRKEVEQDPNVEQELDVASEDAEKTDSEDATQEKAKSEDADESAETASNEEEAPEPEPEEEVGPDDPQAIEALKRIGARLDVNEKGNVWRVFLYDHHGNDNALLFMQGLPGLKDLWVIGTKCTKAGVAEFKEQHPKITVYF